jgi:hypothetical protein
MNDRLAELKRGSASPDYVAVNVEDDVNGILISFTL